jgi:cobalamin-dependent methionine synthase I
MAIPGLNIIGESINDSVPSTKKLFDANDIPGLVELAKTQDEKGAAYIDVNVGLRTPEFMADMVKRVQTVTSKPLSVDTPDYAIAEAGLKAYDLKRAGGKPPVLNSISPLRMKMFELQKIQPFMPILMVSERVENGESKPNHTADETYRAAKQMAEAARKHKIPNDWCIIDCGIAPIASDSEGQLKRLIESLKLLQADPEFKGMHRSVGLSNFTVMMPAKRADGSLVKSALESAFITMAKPLGLDMIIGSVARKYELLPEDHPAMVCIKEVLALDGFDAIMRVKDFYS